MALQGALELIARAGGGVVEGYPQDTQGKKTSASFLYNGTRTMFEKAGFTSVRTKGTKNCVMRPRPGALRSGLGAVGMGALLRGCVSL